MNGLFFGNTAAGGGGVDPRYPKILINDFIVVPYNTVYSLKKRYMVSDNNYAWNNLTDTFTDTSVSTKFSMKTTWSFISRKYTTVDSCVYTVTNPDGFSTSKSLHLYIRDPELTLNINYEGVNIVNVPELISSSLYVDQEFKDIYEIFNYQNCQCFIGDSNTTNKGFDVKTDSAFNITFENQNIKIELKDNSFQGTEEGFIILVDNQPISIVIQYSITVE